VSAEASELVSIPRAELEALKAELKRLRREVGRGTAMARIQADLGPGDDAPVLTREELAEAWGIGEWSPRPLPGLVLAGDRGLAAAAAVDGAAHDFHLLDEPVPTLADPFPSDDPLPSAYELHLPAADVTISYTVTEHEGQEVISVQHVSLDTWHRDDRKRALP
jgi:hypothetical protein